MWKSQLCTNPMASEATAYIGLGGNVGDVQHNICKALDILQSHSGITVKVISRLYKTPPWGVENQDWFLNACAELVTDIDAEALLDVCLDTEKQLNRIRTERWGPRTIDLDVLDYNQQVIQIQSLTLPHPHMHERAFVLMPLADIAPEFVIKGKTCKQLLSLLENEDIQMVVDHQNWWPQKT